MYRDLQRPAKRSPLRYPQRRSPVQSPAAPAKPLFLLGLVHNVDDLINYRRIRELCHIPLALVFQTRHLYHSRLGEQQSRTRDAETDMANSGKEEQKLTVVMSPSWSSSPAKILRMMRRMILPDRVLGRSGTTNIAFGAAKGPIDLRTCRIKSFLTWSVASVPSLSATNALTAWPVSSSLMPTTAASATESVSVSVHSPLGSAVPTVLDERSLNLSSRQPVAGDVHNVVDTASDPVVTLVVAASTVSSELAESVYFL